MSRLDTRTVLYGEPRLSDPAVRALRAAAGPGLIETRDGYSDGTTVHRFGTVRSRALCDLIDLVGGRVVASPRGHSVLAAIDAATAHPGEPS